MAATVNAASPELMPNIPSDLQACLSIALCCLGVCNAVLPIMCQLDLRMIGWHTMKAKHHAKSDNGCLAPCVARTAKGQPAQLAARSSGVQHMANPNRTPLFSNPAHTSHSQYRTKQHKVHGTNAPTLYTPAATRLTGALACRPKAGQGPSSLPSINAPIYTHARTETLSPSRWTVT